ncbi:MAG: helix-turn-helix domain-containing protein [Gammaproteobacteria bacterium]|nr:helix-turn-helix domain-containing protein [Gammaproteobacteria bacterium]
MKLNERIAYLREYNKLSLEDVSNKLNVSMDVLESWEEGAVEPTIEELLLISDFYKISVDELIGNKKYVNSKNKVFYLGYEYKSEKTIGSMPFIHINIGKGKKARGFIAIGNDAKGVIAIGGKAVGVFAVGGLAFGLFALGGVGAGLLSVSGLAIALLMSVGGIAIAPFAVGGLALGLLALGGMSCGLYSIGGLSLGKFVAVGGYAQGNIVIGYQTKGNIVPTSYSKESIRNLILEQYPKTWKFIVDFICTFFK